MSKCAWGIEWHSVNRLDGEERYVLWDQGKPLFFDTRAEARRYTAETYGYIKRRRDLQEEPHGWRMPQIVRVLISVEKVP